MLLAGFKSYAESIEVRGLENFTCIIGSNGAGKSVMVRPPVLQAYMLSAAPQQCPSMHHSCRAMPLPLCLDQLEA